MRKYLARQPVFFLAGAILLGVVAVYTLDRLGAGIAATDVTPGVTPLLLLLTLVASLGRGGQLEGAREKRFWRFLVVAFSIWAVHDWAKLLFAELLADPSPALFTDSFYLVVYLFCLLAAEEVPGAPHLTGPTAAELRLLHRFGLGLFTFAALIYFVLIPSRLSPETYRSLLPSYLLYVFLDLFVAQRFFRASRRSKQGRWRAICRLIAFAFLGWGLVDIADAGTRAEVFEILPGTFLDLSWFAPFLLVVAAFRLRFYRPSLEGHVSSALLLGSGVERLPWRTQAGLLTLPFLLPMVHFIGYSAGLLDSSSRGAREVTLVACVVALALVAVFNVVLHSVARRLERSQRLAALGQLSSGVAHDFNNLLTVIRGHGDLLLAELPRGDPGRSSLREIVSASKRASELTRQLLSFARQDDHERQTVDLNALVRGLRAMLQRLVGERVRLVLRLDPGVDRVYADKSQLEQVVMNLVLNARDAMPDGGRITLVTAKLPRAASETENETGSVLPPGPWVELAVEDGGHGIPEGDLERIFEPFFTTKERSRGTGLGLSMIFGIVSRHGGFVRVESSIGQGTRFEVYLPPSREEPVPRPADQPTPFGETSGRETVLLVEDDPAVRLYGRRVLERGGYEVLEAEDGETALGVLEARGGKVRLLITDVVMPGMSGPALAERVLSEHPRLRVLYVSGYSADEFGNDGPGPDQPLLSKPFSPDDLTRKVEELLA